jgi:TonB family protein
MKLSYYKFILVFVFVLLFASFTSAQTESNKGIELYEKGEYETAVEHLQKAIETDKKDRNSWLYLGMSFARLKKGNEAVRAFKKADELPIKDLLENERAVKITAKPRANYTDLARQNNTSGTVALAVEFGADGNIKSIILVQGLPNGLVEQTISAARKIKFEPAIKDGKSVAAIGIVKYSFTIY